MCTSLILGSIKLSLNIFNILHSCVGLAILIFGVYLQIDYGTFAITIITMVLGVFIMLVGCMGLCSVRSQSHCLLTTYAIFMALLFFGDLVIMIMSFATFDTFTSSDN